ncbi:MAG: malto-oligosyltrehalose synthase [Actinomycetaceae bacterium]|nr:malto-oligosyltrehalose synthase [Actinomycetaceae bacterium]MDY6083279.1 malto-oligosyltrehalose synthase [Actinomycetaceae bacterium]
MAVPHSHIPLHHQPISTYRLQLNRHFTFADAEKIIDYLVDLGITDVYCSPILQAVPGSLHGYDVVDHTHISADLGGQAAFEHFATAAHQAGLGIIVDVVPNHMAVPTPLYLNHALWDALWRGSESPYARWFDIDLDEAADGILLPVLGQRIGKVLTAGELTLDSMVVPGFEDSGAQPVLRYFDHVFPIRTNTEDLPLAELLERQYYRLAYWRVAEEEVNYRRFFDVDTLAAIRVNDPEVFAQSHALLLKEYHAGYIDGFRVDHPDGLADPREYFDRLYDATDGAWIVGEKILEGDEELPADWKVSGTTGYDAQWRITSLLTSPTGTMDLWDVYQELAGTPSSFDSEAQAGKSQMMSTSMHAELEHLTDLLAKICHTDIRLRDYTARSLSDALSALVIAMPHYRAYVVPGAKASSSAVQTVTQAALRAKEYLDEDRQEALEVVVDLVLGREVGSATNTYSQMRAEAIVRFQQLCTSVMAKGVEDTAFYRFMPLVSANEVGSNPDMSTITTDTMNDFVTRMTNTWPCSMTTLMTHDTKRGEDVRLGISTLTQFGALYRRTVRSIRDALASDRPVDMDGQMESLIFQTVIGTWKDGKPIEQDRLHAYLLKAAREQKKWTTWTEQATEAETAMLSYADAICTNDESVALLQDFTSAMAEARRWAILGAKAIQFTAYGVADTYQGEEITHNSLVDPDNRRPVDFQALADLLDRVKSRGGADHQSLDEEKLWLVHQLLSLRQRHSDALFSSEAGFMPLASTTGFAWAYARTVGGTPAFISVIGRFAAEAKWGTHVVVLPDAGDGLAWHDVLSDHTYHAGSTLVGELLADYPVAVLEAVPLQPAQN